jgi:hypothetical protein
MLIFQHYAGKIALQDPSVKRINAENSAPCGGFGKPAGRKIAEDKKLE